VRWSATRLLISCSSFSSHLPNSRVTPTNDEEHAHDNQPDDNISEDDDDGGFDEHEDTSDNVMI